MSTFPTEFSMKNNWMVQMKSVHGSLISILCWGHLTPRLNMIFRFFLFFLPCFHFRSSFQQFVNLFISITKCFLSNAHMDSNKYWIQKQTETHKSKRSNYKQRLADRSREHQIGTKKRRQKQIVLDKSTEKHIKDKSR